MSDLTYRDYLKYLNYKMKGVNVDTLTPDEVKYFKLIKKQLESVPSLPSYILDEPLLSSKDYDEETLLAVAEIKNTLTIGNRTSGYFSKLFSDIKQRFDSVFSNIRAIEIVGIFAGSFLFVAVVVMVLNSATAVNDINLAGVAGSPVTTMPTSPSVINIASSGLNFFPGCLLGALIFLFFFLVFYVTNNRDSH